MNFDLNSRGSKYEQEKQKRREEAKRKIERERKIREQVLEQQQQMELQRVKQRQALLEQKEQEEAQKLELERITGGIHYVEELIPYPTTTEGDKITLPVSALEKLNPQDVLTSRTALTFELSILSDKTEDTSLLSTHAGVVEFTAPEGYVGLPPNTIQSLMKKNQLTSAPASVQIRYRRLERGKFARFQPLGEGFGKRELDLKELFERSLHQRITLSEQDIIIVRQGGQTFEIAVRELEPESAVLILNTDLEIDVMPSEADEAMAQEAERLQAQDRTAVEERACYRGFQMKLASALPAEPPKGETTGVIRCMVKLSDGSEIQRPFYHSDTFQSLFDYVIAQSEFQLFQKKDTSQPFQLVSRYPRRVFTIGDAVMTTADGQSKSKTFKEMNLVGKQERFFVEKNIMSITGDGQTSPRNASNSFCIGAKDESMSSDESKTSESIEGKQKSNLQPNEWAQAQEQYISTVDQKLKHDGQVPIHALEPILPTPAPLATGLDKWTAQLQELEAMGFSNRQVNSQLLDRYQGRLLRVVNYLSEMTSFDSNDEQHHEEN